MSTIRLHAVPYTVIIMKQSMPQPYLAWVSFQQMILNLLNHCLTNLHYFLSVSGAYYYFVLIYSSKHQPNSSYYIYAYFIYLFKCLFFYQFAHLFSDLFIRLFVRSLHQILFFFLESSFFSIIVSFSSFLKT